MRCARAAPSTRPMTEAPAIAIADTYSVRTSASKSSSKFSVTADPSNTRITSAPQRGAAAPRAAAPSLMGGVVASRLRRAHRRRIDAAVAERVLRAQDAPREERDVRPGHVGTQDVHERVAFSHQLEP